MTDVYVTYNATQNGIQRGTLDRETIIPPIGAYIFIEGAEESEWFPNSSWFIRLKSAIKNAEKQRDAKILQLGNQIDKLKRMEFK